MQWPFAIPCAPAACHIGRRPENSSNFFRRGWHKSKKLCIVADFVGLVAQLVEQRIENPRVGGSIPPQATRISQGQLFTQLAFFIADSAKITNAEQGRALPGGHIRGDNIRGDNIHPKVPGKAILRASRRALVHRRGLTSLPLTASEIRHREQGQDPVQPAAHDRHGTVLYRRSRARQQTRG